MALVSRTIPVDAATVFAALTDPRTYPHWLVGARDIRAVDDGWPEPGTAFHHRVGLVGPLKVSDLSKVVDIEVDRRLSLEVRARPFGRGRATFVLEEHPGPTPSTTVALDEIPLGRLRPLQPVLDPLTARRNERSLAQLEDHLITGTSHRAPG